MECLFCSQAIRDVAIMENDGAFAIYDKYPQSKGHVLIIPKNHSENFFETTMPERLALYMLLDRVKNYLDEKYSPDGYNVVLNCGKAAGQEIMHTHIHLIPRYS